MTDRRVETANKTGWPAHMLQDDSKKLTEWFASRIDARWTVRQVCKEIADEKMKDRIIELAKLAGMEVHPRKMQIRVGADAVLGLDSTEVVTRFAELVRNEALDEVNHEVSGSPLISNAAALEVQAILRKLSS